MPKEKLTPEAFSQKYKDKFCHYIRLNDYRKVKSYLMNGMNPNMPNNEGNLPIFAATYHYEMFKLLMDYNVETNIDKTDFNLLHHACYNRDIEVIKYMIENIPYYGINDLSKEKKTPLYYVLIGFNNIFANQDLEKWMIEKGAKMELILPLLNEGQLKSYEINQLIEYEKIVNEKKQLSATFNETSIINKKLKI